MTSRRRVRGLRKFARDDSGAAAVEFAMVSVAFIIMMFGIIYAGLILYHKSTLKWAVEQVARSAAINPTISQSTIQTAINNYLSGMGAPTAAVTYSVGTSNGVPAGLLYATFTRSYTVPMVATFTMTVTEAAVIPQGS